MAEPFYNVSFKNPINANSRKPDGLYNSDSSQDNGDHASMNRPLASELSSSCTYDRNSSTSQPKSDHSFIEHGDSVGITEVSSSDKIVSYGDRNAELGLDLTLCVNHVGRKHTYPEPNPLIAVKMEQERILTGKEHGRSVGLTEVSSSDKIGSYGDRNLSLGLDLKLWVNDVVKKHTDREPNPPIAAGMEQEGILTVKDFIVPAANRKYNNMNMYSDSRNMMNAMEEFNGRYHEAIASQPTQVQCSGLVTLKQHQQKTRGIVWNEAKDLAFSSNTSRQSRSFSTNHSGMGSADALCNFGREKAGQLSSFDHNSTENQFIIVEDYSATKGEVIGWPPIWAYRENSLSSLPKTSGESQQGAMEGSFEQILRNSLSVKVNTDGMPIGRKVDLNGYESYENLARDLENMFQLTNQNHIGACIPMGNEHSIKPLSLLDPASDFVLTYEDGEGNCMLVGDVPWKMFLHKVKRLRIMKSSSTNAFSQICSKKRKAT